MKNMLVGLLILISFLLPTVVFGTPITYKVGETNVGYLDECLGAANLSSGDNTVLTWVKSVLAAQGLDSDVIMDDKYEKVNNTSLAWVPTNDPSVYAFNFTDTPDYYIMKTGNLGSGLNTFLFQNLEDLSWAVVNLGTYKIFEIGKISHVTSYEPVPEPGTIILLGTGLFGLAFYGRKRMKK